MQDQLATAAKGEQQLQERDRQLNRLTGQLAQQQMADEPLAVERARRVDELSVQVQEHAARVDELDAANRSQGQKLQQAQESANDFRDNIGGSGTTVGIAPERLGAREKTVE